MSTLRITLFGGVDLNWAGRGPSLALAPSLQLLFAYLLLHRSRSHSRELLAEYFWADSDMQHARAALSTALWRLRRDLERHVDATTPYLTISSCGEIRFNLSSDYWLDVADFEEKITSALPRDGAEMDPSTLPRLESALSLYRGDLLEGFYVDWALRERERLRLLYLNALAHLTHFHGRQGSLEKSIEYGQAILAIDPLREEIHRELMRAYVANGQRTLALRQYEVCSTVLQEELSIEPMEETRMLWREIRQNDSLVSIPQPSAPMTGLSSHVDSLQRELNAAQHHFDEARRHMDEAILIARRLEPGAPHSIVQ